MIRFLRIYLRILVFAGAGALPLTGLAALAGLPEAPAYVLGATIGVAASCAPWRHAKMAALRKATGRGKPDYARTRLLERQLGMEPSEPCMPVSVPPAVTSFQRAADRYLEDGFAELARAMRASGVSIGRVGCNAPGCECLWCEEKRHSAGSGTPGQRPARGPGGAKLHAGLPLGERFRHG